MMRVGGFNGLLELDSMLLVEVSSVKSSVWKHQQKVFLILLANILKFLITKFHKIHVYNFTELSKFWSKITKINEIA